VTHLVHLDHVVSLYIYCVPVFYPQYPDNASINGATSATRAIPTSHLTVSAMSDDLTLYVTMHRHVFDDIPVVRHMILLVL